MSIRYILKNYFLLLIFLQTSTYLSAQNNTRQIQNWQNQDLGINGVFGISSEKAYAHLLKSKSYVPVVVAVIDGGVDIQHSGLKEALWTNLKEIQGNGKDDDANGYIDDVHGWNFLGSTKSSFYFDNKNVVRLLRAAIKEDPNSDRTKALQNDYENKRKALERALKVTEAQRIILLDITKNIKKEYPSVNEFENYIYRNVAEEKVLIMVVRGLKADPDFRSTFEEKYKLYKDQLNYLINIDYDPRSGNAEYQAKIYGNNDVQGVDPYHGTHVAGIIASTSNNGFNLGGGTPHSKIMVIRAIPNGDIFERDLAEAIRYAVDNDAKVINLSTGTDFFSNRKLVDSAVRYAMQKDVLIVHGAGNNGVEIKTPSFFPTRYYEGGGIANGWLEVSASAMDDNEDLVARFSNYGKNIVDVFAPGVNIYSTFPGNKYKYLSGTSMATPVVAGLAALLRSYYPKLTAIQVKDIIMKSVVKREVLKDKCISGGVVNAYEALKLAANYSTQ